MTAALALAAHPENCRCRGTGWVCEDHPDLPAVDPGCPCQAPGRRCPGPVVQDLARRNALAVRGELAEQLLQDESDDVRAGFAAALHLRHLGATGDVAGIHALTAWWNPEQMRQVIATLAVCNRDACGLVDVVLLAGERLASLEELERA